MALVLGLILLFGIVTGLGGPPDGANIGAGILLLPLLPLGLPWSLPLIIDPYRFDSAADSFSYAVYFAPAVLVTGSATSGAVTALTTLTAVAAATVMI